MNIFKNKVGYLFICLNLTNSKTKLFPKKPEV